jgi:hypothetical protein
MNHICSCHVAIPFNVLVQAEVVAQSTSRRKRQIVIEHCDIIGAKFWKDNPSLLGQDLEPSKKALEENGAEENGADRELGA